MVENTDLGVRAFIKMRKRLKIKFFSSGLIIGTILVGSINLVNSNWSIYPTFKHDFDLKNSWEQKNYIDEQRKCNIHLVNADDKKLQPIVTCNFSAHILLRALNKGESHSKTTYAIRGEQIPINIAVKKGTKFSLFASDTPIVAMELSVIERTQQ